MIYVRINNSKKPNNLSFLNFFIVIKLCKQTIKPIINVGHKQYEMIFLPKVKEHICKKPTNNIPIKLINSNLFQILLLFIFI